MNQRSIGRGVLEQLHPLALDLELTGEDRGRGHGLALEDLAPQVGRPAQHEPRFGVRGLVDELDVLATATRES